MELTKIFYFFEKVSKSLVKGSVLVRYWFGDFSHGSGFGSAEPKNPGSVVHYHPPTTTPTLPLVNLVIQCPKDSLLQSIFWGFLVSSPRVDNTVLSSQTQVPKLRHMPFSSQGMLVPKWAKTKKYNQIQKEKIAKVATKNRQNRN